ncbi:MAG: polysaccharide export protein EpsE [Aquabacterium sp.]
MNVQSTFLGTRRALLALLGSFFVWAGLPAAALAQGAGTAATSTEYRLGAGDVVRVTVYQNPDLTLEARVSEAGVISYPLLGSVRLGQMSVGQAEKVIADGLRTGNFVKQPQVSIIVLQVRGNQISVLGQVNRPGRYPLEAAEMRLSDMLANAGGVAPSGAEILTLVGTRDGKPFRKEIDLPAMFRDASRADDVLMVNGDVIYVDRAPLLYIYGEVQRPGPVRLERGMTLMQVLATGGGLNARGTEKGIRVHRRGSDGKVQVLQPAMDDALRDGDVVYVRESLF